MPAAWHGWHVKRLVIVPNVSAIPAQHSGVHLAHGCMKKKKGLAHKLTGGTYTRMYISICAWLLIGQDWRCQSTCAVVL